MMRARTTAPAFAPVKDKPFVSAGKAADQSAGGSPQPEDVKWEVRPCGMLVQKRSPDSSAAGPPAPTIRVRVKYGSAHHEIYLSSQASFGKYQQDTLVFCLVFPLNHSGLYFRWRWRWRWLCRGAEEAAGGADGPPPAGPEATVQGQGEGVDGVPGHRRREGPLQDRPRRGSHRPGPTVPGDAEERQDGEGRQVHLPDQPRGRQARHQGRQPPLSVRRVELARLPHPRRRRPRSSGRLLEPSFSSPRRSRHWNPSRPRARRWRRATSSA